MGMFSKTRANPKNTSKQLIQRRKVSTYGFPVGLDRPMAFDPPIAAWPVLAAAIARLGQD
jgi:hypothetical protein